MSCQYTAEENGVRFLPLGDRAIVVDWGGGIRPDTRAKIQTFCLQLERNPFPGLLETVPAFTSVTVFYEPMKLLASVNGNQWMRDRYSAVRSPFEIAREIVGRLVSCPGPAASGSIGVVEIPVCYGGDFGPDLHEVAAQAGLSPEQVIEIHSSRDYSVYMIGFAPGFPYLGGMSERIACPRRSSPRLQIPPGSVGIGGKQTGIYPISTPGGWQLIGKTPLKLFRPDHPMPSLLKAGDIVRFNPICAEQYAGWREERI